MHFSKEQVDKLFASGGSLVDGEHYRVMAAHRTTPGCAEIHVKDTDIFYILDGTATIITGGKIADEYNEDPDEIRGKSIEGGQSQRLSKGDLIVIPQGTPHWIEKVEGTFNYLVVKAR